MTLSPFTIFLAAVFTNNILLTHYLGMCSFVALSRRLDTALGMGLAVTFVSTCTSALNWLIYYGLLREGALDWLPGNLGANVRLEVFSLIIFIAVIAAFVQVVEMVLDRFSPALYQALGIFLPLITVNCAILGVSLFMVIRGYGFFQSVAFGFGSGVGWLLAALLMAGLRRRLRFSTVPAGLEGIGVTLILTGIMAMGFMAFNGMVRIQ